jgi:hypothetical protein
VVAQELPLCTYAGCDKLVAVVLRFGQQDGRDLACGYCQAHAREVERLFLVAARHEVDAADARRVFAA